MSGNSPEEKKLDEDLKDAQAHMAGHIEPDEGEEPAEEGKEDEPKKEGKSDGGDEGAPAPKEDDEEPEKPKDPKPSDDDESGDGSGDEGVQEPQRSQKYIPVAKYQDGKKRWKETSDELEVARTRIKQLESQNTPSAEQQKEKLVKDIIAEYPDADEKLINTILTASNAQSNASIKSLEEKVTGLQSQSENLNEAEEEKKDQAYFDREYDKQISPMVAKEHPDASKAAVAKAKEYIEQIAHSEDYFKKHISFVYADHKKEIGEILATRSGKTSVEQGRTRSRTSHDLKASDFRKDKDGKYDFSRLFAMEEGTERRELVSGLDPFAYQDYVHELGNREQQQGMDVKRGGVRVNLK